jgi:hypothetical protein
MFGYHIFACSWNASFSYSHSAVVLCETGTLSAHHLPLNNEWLNVKLLWRYNWQRKTKVPRDKHVPVQLCPPQIPLALPWSRTCISDVKRWWLTAVRRQTGLFRHIDCFLSRVHINWTSSDSSSSSSLNGASFVFIVTVHPPSPAYYILFQYSSLLRNMALSSLLK